MGNRDKRLKRLLLAPLLIALSGCSNEVTVKTDVGEKYIVKDSAVTLSPYTNNDLIEGLERTIKEKETYLGTANPRNKYGKPWSIYFAESNAEKCVRNGLGSQQFCQDKQFTYSSGTWDSVVGAYYRGLKQIKDALALLKNDSTKVIHIKEIKFRPILKDLNGNSRALTYMTVDCFNPSVVGMKNIWKTVYPSINEPEPSSGLALDLLEKKLCDKYAKF